jgi:hypothetical protein
MEKIPMTSRKLHKFRGKIRKIGEVIYCTESESRALKAMGRADLIEHAPAPVTVEPEEKPKRTYKRKDVEKAPESVTLEAEKPLNAWAYPKTPTKHKFPPGTEYSDEE